MSEATPEDVQEQQQSPSREAAPSVEPATGTEVPEADAAEQAVEVDLDEDERR